jgi:hypothetical protein
VVGQGERGSRRPLVEHGPSLARWYPRPVLEVTDWARDILMRSHHAARRFDPSATIRLARMGGEVQAQLAEAPHPHDQPVDLGEVRIYVEAGLEGLIDVEEPHDRLVLRPSGSVPNQRPTH